MIIVFSNTVINQRAVAALLAKKYQHVFSLEDISSRTVTPLVIDPEDDTLTIIDLNANGNLQKLYAPHTMAQRLENIGVLEHISAIQLLISDIVPEKSMQGFATDLSRELVALNPETTIMIRVPADLVDCMLIIPPEIPEGDWNLYSGSSTDIENAPSKEGAVDFYKSKMTLIFSGTLEAAFQNPDYEFSSQSTREIYGKELDDSDLGMRT